MRKLFLLVIAVMTVPAFATPPTPTPGPGSGPQADSANITGNVLPWMMITSAGDVPLQVTAPAGRVGDTNLLPGDTVSATANFAVLTNIDVNVTAVYVGVDWIHKTSATSGLLANTTDDAQTASATVGGIVPWHQKNGNADGVLTVTIASS